MLYQFVCSVAVVWSVAVGASVAGVAAVVVAQLENFYGGVANDTAVAAMIQSLYIQRYLHSILIEVMENAYFLLLGHHLIMLRLFKMKQNSTNNDNGYKLSMRSCGEFGSIISLHVHIYRLATASLLACTERRCWDRILSEAKNAALCHMFSPLINKTKNMNGFRSVSFILPF